MDYIKQEKNTGKALLKEVFPDGKIIDEYIDKWNVSIYCALQEII